ncbi:dihydroorotase [Loigolactobacillus backii]|uniref:Dihydroorotase n=1 Tax=Loigolactobacillus backii TaxID=375175 RepID=A0A192H3I9_9LACO|nr:dihydroorotase [Loigolactobacillus backii]ANK59506.1 dihydroorotase [Loigolactobacillus backii]ANK62935.1 dihydroorotase [Loigolactobacillus backii]ANK64499.1 dihydroorotase [Loigolactobacillus backii]ANK67105.1 dihydroorotase [Loigolactobacillus backii]ANK70057.1 dihydroorotase [Loigolactobacillus backii]
MTETILKNGRVWLDGHIQTCDLLIENAKIKAIGQNLTSPTAKVIDVSNQLVAPGLVDLHVHLRDPGQTAKETIKTGSLAAAHGGFTTIGAMPNVTPVPDTAEQIATLVARNANEGVVHIKQYAPITKQRRAGALTDFAAMKTAGAFAVSNDGSGVQDAGSMFQALKEAQANDLPLAAHVEEDKLLFGGVMNAGAPAKRLGLPGIINAAETSQLARDLELAQQTGAHYHMCHVSTAESVRLIRQAKAAGIKVTCEVTPHHLLLSDDMIKGDDANFKMNPPLRSEQDRQALVAGLLDGTINCIATDHAPHTAAEKQQGFLKSPFGIVGSETAFSLLYTHFVKENIFSLNQLLNWLSTKPAQIFGLKNTGYLGLGTVADIAVFDLNTATTIETDTFLSKGHNSPFIGQSVFGTTTLTLVAGKVAYQKGGTTK